MAIPPPSPTPRAPPRRGVHERNHDRTRNTHLVKVHGAACRAPAEQRAALGARRGVARAAEREAWTREVALFFHRLPTENVASPLGRHLKTAHITGRARSRSARAAAATRRSSPRTCNASREIGNKNGTDNGTVDDEEEAAASKAKVLAVADLDDQYIATITVPKNYTNNKNGSRQGRASSSRPLRA